VSGAKKAEWRAHWLPPQKQKQERKSLQPQQQVLPCGCQRQVPWLDTRFVVPDCPHPAQAG